MAPAENVPENSLSLSTVSGASTNTAVVCVAEIGVVTVALVASAVLVSKPVVVTPTLTVMVNTADPPGAILVGPHVTALPTLVHPAEALTNVVPGGIVSDTVTPVAVDGPGFETVIV